jgi:hypothetical protein
MVSYRGDRSHHAAIAARIASLEAELGGTPGEQAGAG